MDLELRILQHRVEDQLREGDYCEIADDLLVLARAVLTALNALDRARHYDGLTADAAGELADTVRDLVAVVL